MAFTRKQQYGPPIDTAKDNEKVHVQLVDVNGTLRLEARAFVDSDSYNGPTKVALAFTTQAQVDDFVAALATGRDDLPTEVAAKAAKVVDAAATVVPVKPVQRGAAVRRAATKAKAAKAS